MLLLLSVGVLFLRLHHKSDTGSPPAAQEPSNPQKVNDMTDSLSKDDLEYIQLLDDQIREAKEDGMSEDYIAKLEKERDHELQNPATDEYDLLQYLEDGIRKAKERGSSETFIAGLEQQRDEMLEIIAMIEEYPLRMQEERAKFKAMSNEERITYYEDKLQSYEDQLRIAKADNDVQKIKGLEIWIEATKESLEWARGAPERRRQDVKVKQMKGELDDLLKWAQNWEDEWIEKYRPLSPS